MLSFQIDSLFIDIFLRTPLDVGPREGNGWTEGERGKSLRGLGRLHQLDEDAETLWVRNLSRIGNMSQPFGTFGSFDYDTACLLAGRQALMRLLSLSLSLSLSFSVS